MEKTSCTSNKTEVIPNKEFIEDPLDHFVNKKN